MKNKELYRYYVLDRENRGNRIRVDEDLAKEYSALGLSPEERMCRRFELLCSAEQPVIQPFEKIAMVRTVENIPDCFTEAEWESIRKDHYIHELGYVSNLSPDYETTIKVGLLERRKSANVYQTRMIDSIIGLCDRYRDEAERQGRDDLAEIFSRVPRYGARNFRWKLKFLAFIIIQKTNNKNARTVLRNVTIICGIHYTIF